MIDISPEKFLESCSLDELQEVVLLLNSPRFANKLKEHKDTGEINEDIEDPRQMILPWWEDVKQVNE